MVVVLSSVFIRVILEHSKPSFCITHCLWI